MRLAHTSKENKHKEKWKIESVREREKETAKQINSHEDINLNYYSQLTPQK